LFSLFKYSVYTALLINVGLFLSKEVVATNVRFEAIGWLDIIDAYASTIDTAAWVFLLLLFELETYLLSESVLKSGYRWLSRGIRGMCYVFIMYAFVGYVSHLQYVLDFKEVTSSTCEVIGDQWMMEIDEFMTINKDNCVALGASVTLLKKSTAAIYTNLPQWKVALNLAWTDIFNSAAWILIVLVLEVDVYLQAANNFTSWKYQSSRITKTILYSIVLVAAIYWGYEGELLEFWDAFLWIVAFVFIETNLFFKDNPA